MTQGPMIVSRDFLRLLWIASHPENRPQVEAYDKQLPDHFSRFIIDATLAEQWVMNTCLSIYEQTGVANLITQSTSQGGMIVPSYAGYEFIYEYFTGGITDADLNKGTVNYAFWLTAHDPHPSLL